MKYVCRFRVSPHNSSTKIGNKVSIEYMERAEDTEIGAKDSFKRNQTDYGNTRMRAINARQVLDSYVVCRLIISLAIIGLFLYMITCLPTSSTLNQQTGQEIIDYIIRGPNITNLFGDIPRAFEYKIDNLNVTTTEKE